MNPEKPGVEAATYSGQPGLEEGEVVGERAGGVPRDRRHDPIEAIVGGAGARGRRPADLLGDELGEAVVAEQASGGVSHLEATVAEQVEQAAGRDDQGLFAVACVWEEANERAWVAELLAGTSRRERDEPS